jgi:hypothetical protein
MSGRLAVALMLVALVAVPVAHADGPMPYASQLGDGVLSPDGTTRYLALAASQTENTLVEAVKTDGGTVRGSLELVGRWGIPIVTYDQAGAGLTPDGKTLVLGDAVPVMPRTTSKFLVLDPVYLRPLHVFALKGDFAFDAISPNGARLYLIQHVDPTDTQRYVVRAYDLAAERLLPGRIADRTQKGWVMQGYPIARTSTADGRWVYTLYQNPGGYPFVHALDTVRGVAHCVGLPWRGSQDVFYNMRLTLHGRSLAVHWLSGRPWLRIDTRTWNVTPDHRAGVAWLLAVGGAALALLGLAAALVRRRRRRTKELDQELAELLGLAEREVVV